MKLSAGWMVGFASVFGAIWVAAISFAVWTDRTGPNVPLPAISNPSPSGIVQPTQLEQVRVSAYGVRIIACTDRDYYQDEPPPALCFYAENGHVSPAHPPTVTPTPGGQQ